VDIVVCVKRVPDVAEAEISVRPDGKEIVREGLIFDINEWDNYAAEEAIRIKERMGGKVTVISLGDDDSKEVIRRCLAMGADEGILLNDPSLFGGDAHSVARALWGAIKDLKYDMVLTGVQAADDGYAQVGPILAQMLGIPHVTMVTGMEVEEGRVKVRRELEEGWEEELEVRLPALFSIQTGINEPRYVSIMGIRKARQKEIRAMGLKELGLEEREVGQEGSLLELERLFVPEASKRAEILSGDLGEVASRVAEIIKEKGGL